MRGGGGGGGGVCVKEGDGNEKEVHSMLELLEE